MVAAARAALNRERQADACGEWGEQAVGEDGARLLSQDVARCVPRLRVLQPTCVDKSMLKCNSSRFAPAENVFCVPVVYVCDLLGGSIVQ